MAKAIEDRGALTVGHFGLGTYRQGIGAVAKVVHDGDTIITRALGNLNVRFLGIDTPEISFNLPDSKQQFTSLTNSRWETFLSNPFINGYDLPADLKANLMARLGAGCATNHAEHAEAAQRALEAEISQDIEETQSTKEEFEFFLAFANEVMDQYGRLLAYINRNQVSKPRPLDYNSRLLQMGFANPYLIWPNINPFRKRKSIIDSVPKPGTANKIANQESTLRDAREWIKDARAQGVRGLFNRNNPLRLEAFELRYLAQQRQPNRWVIDLSRNDEVLLRPEHYFQIPYPEDRLFIPEEYVPLFVDQGWKKQAKY